MSIEQAHLARVRPYMLSAKAADIISVEAHKGCEPFIVSQPVALEPAYEPIVTIGQAASANTAQAWTPETPVSSEDLVRMQAWVSPRQCCKWRRSELFIKFLSHLRYRAAFEILGNKHGVRVQLLCHVDDAPVVQAAFAGQFELCELVRANGDALQGIPSENWEQVVFCDYFPSPPYSHLLTSPDELQRSPFAMLITAMADISEPALGVYQVVFMPVSPHHDWHNNIQVLVNLEYQVKLLVGMGDPTRLPQQVPSDALLEKARAVQDKAHNDKPLFAVAMRIGVLNGGRRAEELIRVLSAVTGLIQHGGRPLCVLTESDYGELVAPTALRRMFNEGLTHRPGFLLNSWELTSLVHFAPSETTQHIRETRLNNLETLPPEPALRSGTPIGFYEYAGVRQPVCIPLSQRCKHAHLVGRTGAGKSTVELNMILDDVRRGVGVAVIDPHGDLVDEVLVHLSKEDVERTIYFDPGDPDWVPLWNPIRCLPGQDVGRTADNLVGAFKSIVTGWGDRLEHLLRHVFHGALSIPRSTLLDISNVLRTKSDESRRIRHNILEAIDNEAARPFWLHDIEGYRKDDLGPPRNKLSKLLLSGTVSMMLAQPEHAIDFPTIMDDGMILLVNLSTIGTQVRGVLGSLMIALFHEAALARSARPKNQRKEFQIYCDEAHRFVTDALEDLIAETRKYNVGLTLAHQKLSQFPDRKSDALSGVVATIIFNVDATDARHLKQGLRGLVEVEDLIALEPYKAIARIGNRVVRFETNLLPDPEESGYREEIIRRSRQHYCRPAAEVRRWIRSRARDWVCSTPSNPMNLEDQGELGHDTF